MRLVLAVAVIFALVAVALGAMGAHILGKRLSGDAMGVFRTGVEYQTVHSLGMALAVVVDRLRLASGLALPAAWVMAAGIVLFSGSLYGLAGTGKRVLGVITPVGGLCFLGGWALLAIAVIRG